MLRNIDYSFKENLESGIQREKSTSSHGKMCQSFSSPMGATELKSSNLAVGGLTLESTDSLYRCQKIPCRCLLRRRGVDEASVLDDLGTRTG